MTGVRKSLEILAKMAKRRKRSKKRSSVQRRKPYIRQPIKVLDRPKKARRDLRYVQDRRLFRPEWIEGYKTLDGRPVAYVQTERSKTTGREVSFGLSKIGFADPRSVVVCKRRSNRRRALFAKKIIGRGKGSGKFKKRIITDISKVRC